MKTEPYTNVYTLYRCGSINRIANKEEMKDLPLYDTDNEGNIIEMENMSGKTVVLNHVWKTISHEYCALYKDGYCFTRRYCKETNARPFYCHPIPFKKKRINDACIRIFLFYLTDRFPKIFSEVFYNEFLRECYNNFLITYDIINDLFLKIHSIRVREHLHLDPFDLSIYFVDKKYQEFSVELEKIIDSWGETCV